MNKGLAGASFGRSSPRRGCEHRPRPLPVWEEQDHIAQARWGPCRGVAGGGVTFGPIQASTAGRGARYSACPFDRPLAARCGRYVPTSSIRTRGKHWLRRGSLERRPSSPGLNEGSLPLHEDSGGNIGYITTRKLYHDEGTCMYIHTCRSTSHVCTYLHGPLCSKPLRIFCKSRTAVSYTHA